MIVVLAEVLECACDTERQTRGGAVEGDGGQVALQMAKLSGFRRYSENRKGKQRSVEEMGQERKGRGDGGGGGAGGGVGPSYVVHKKGESADIGGTRRGRPAAGPPVMH